MFFKKPSGNGAPSLAPPVPVPLRTKPLINLEDALARHCGSEVPSPCVAVCHLEASSGLCSGCHRTAEEIGRWSVLTDAERIDVWKKIESRQLLIRR